MAWTSPKTWTTGEIVTAGKLNEQLRDNLLYLGDPPLNIDAGLLYTDTVNDRVGIRTTSPSATLDIQKDTSAGVSELLHLANLAAANAANAVSLNFRLKNDLGSEYDFARITVTSVNPNSPSEDAEVGFDVMTAGGTNTRIMTFKNGNVGIRTTSPGYPFQLRRPGGAGSLGITINALLSAYGRDVQFITVPDASADLAGFLFTVHNGANGDVNAMAIKEDGKVGIGTMIPDNELEVVGAVKISGGYPILWFENTDWPGTVRFIHYDTGSLCLYDDVNSRMRARFEANGNVIFCEVAGKVGIATTSPEQKLDVAGTVQLRRVANADATNTLRDSSILQFQGAFWDGTASIKQEMYLKLDVYDEMTNAYRLTLFDTGDGWRAAFDVWGNDTILKVHGWLDGHSKIAFWEANSQKYNLGYDAVFDRWELYSATAGADIIRIPDAQLTVDGNSTFDDNAFDFHCQECDWSSAFEAKECPECGGKVEWLDDVALVVASTVANKVCELPKETLRKLEKLGIINTYGTLDRPGRPEIFLRLTQSYWFALSAIKQLYEKVKHLEAELEAHKAGAVI